MSNHGRRVLTPVVSRKRKEREEFDAVKSSLPSTVVTTTSGVLKEEPASKNRLLAGYLAYEFLTEGTILGKKWDPARAEAEPRKVNIGSNSRAEIGKAPREAGEGKLKNQSYADVAGLLKTDGAHIPGIVNPSQLARWLQM